MSIEPILTASEVHIWLASLEQPTELVSRFLATLNPDEQERAARFVFEKDRRHFTVARGILRALLGQYLQTSAGEIHFVYNAYGKPALQSPAPQFALNFNLSHSHELALYAFAVGREIGVDIEYMRDIAMDEYLSIARSHFSSGEYATLQELPESQRKQGFFNCWTRKEAYIKTRGQGLAIPLDSFDVSLLPGAPAILLASHEAPYTVATWSLSLPSVPPNYAAALMVEGHDYTTRFFNWQPDLCP
ncbi:MAG TPA: 4'-phosphopantetheinyl transferase superfamily protein [Ktedonobacteraceae bacterium]